MTQDARGNPVFGNRTDDGHVHAWYWDWEQEASRCLKCGLGDDGSDDEGPEYQDWADNCLYCGQHMEPHEGDFIGPDRRRAHLSCAS